MTETVQIAAKYRNYTLHIEWREAADVVILYLAMPREIDGTHALYQRVRELSGFRECTLATLEIEDWNGELTPWQFRDEGGKMSFDGRGEELLSDLEQTVVPHLCGSLRLKQDPAYLVIAGYSLAGLFALWTMYQTELFQAVVSCSGSLWYPGFLQYATEHTLQAECDIYLSLGDREEKTRNPYMAQVGTATRTLHQVYREDERIRHTSLEWNVGNHFQEPMERLAKGMAWSLGNYDCKG